MRYIDLFVRDHPEMDVERAVAVNCPQDFWEDADDAPEFCRDGMGVGGYEACRRCWEREAEVEDSPSSAPSGHIPPLGDGLSWEQEAELTGTDMGAASARTRPGT